MHGQMQDEVNHALTLPSRKTGTIVQCEPRLFHVYAHAFEILLAATKSPRFIPHGMLIS